MDNACFCCGQRLLLEISLCFTNQPFDIQIVSIECIYFVILAFYNWMKYLIRGTNNITICCCESSKSIILTTADPVLDTNIWHFNYFPVSSRVWSIHCTRYLTREHWLAGGILPWTHLLLWHMAGREWCCIFLSVSNDSSLQWNGPVRTFLKLRSSFLIQTTIISSIHPSQCLFLD